MSRRNIFDILEEEIDIDFEINRIESLCKNFAIVFDEAEGWTLENYIDDFCLSEWKNRNRAISCEDIREKLEITSFYIKNGLKNEQILIYLEYMSNLIYLCNNSINDSRSFYPTASYKYMQENILEIIHYLNYETMIFDEEQRVLLIEKNASATAVVEIIEPELAFSVIEYNHFLLKGEIDKKQKILKVLADKFEPIRSELRKINKDLESNTGYLLNKMNIRHNNIEGKSAIPYVRGLSHEELEQWYDETYQMLLLCILEHQNIKRNEKVNELKKIIENK